LKTSKIKIILSASALVLGAAMFSSAQDADYTAMMKTAVAANGALQKSVTTDLAATADNAMKVKDAFAKIEAYWTKKGASDAATFAKNIEMDADDVHAAAVAGKQDDATAAAKKIGANCGGCHTAHRDKAADGSFTIK
jgi:cytochrome c556